MKSMMTQTPVESVSEMEMPKMVVESVVDDDLPPLQIKSSASFAKKKKSN